MDSNKLKTRQKRRRKIGIRKRIIGTSDRPRLTVYRSLRHVYAQIIDDLAGRTLAHADSRSLGAEAGNNAGAAQVGKQLAERAAAAGVQQVAFDRNGRKYHGRIKALAEAVRKGGLKF